MKNNRLSTIAKGIILEASEIAAESKSGEVEIIDLGIALLNDNFEVSLCSELEEVGENPAFLKDTLLFLKGEGQHEESKEGGLKFSNKLEKLLANAAKVAQEFDVEFQGKKWEEKITPTHLFIALLKSGEDWLDNVFEDKETLTEELMSLIRFSKNEMPINTTFFIDENGSFVSPKQESLDSFEGFVPESQGQEEDGSEEGQQVEVSRKGLSSPLERFATNLTANSENLDDVIGREEEIDLIIETLLQKNKPNPMLLGDSGVGKTAIVEGFAKKLKTSNSILKNATIFDLSISSLVSGTKYRGEFEKRIEDVLKDVCRRNNSGQNIILFIDEFHMVVGSGKTEGGNMDGGNLLKRALARGDIKCIGATTPEEYKKSVEKDPALARRFVTINVKEPSVEETVEILMKSKDRFEEHHNVKFTKPLIEKLVYYCEKFLPSKNFPDKAFSVLDSVGARKINKAFKFPQDVIDCDLEMERLLNDSDVIKSFFETEDQESYVEKIKTVNEKREKSLTKHLKKYEKKINVTHEDLIEVVSKQSGIPKEMIAKTQNELLKNLEANLLKDVFGQDETVKAVCDAIKVSYFGLSESGKPLSTFLFDGSSGVGKTFIAKKLAENVFGSEKKLIKIDMSEYSSETSVTKLIGADPGYVGYESGSNLIDSVIREPYSVILLDEIEKCHTKAKNLLLQVMNEGVLTDSSGRKADFSNCIIIMTSNASSKVNNKTVGFGAGFEYVKQQKSANERKRALDKKFSPEFISRITSIQFFNDLSEKDLLKIAESSLAEIKKFLRKEKKITLKYTKKLLDFLVKNDTIQVGARQVLNRVENDFKTQLVSFILSQGTNIESVSVTVSEKEEFVFSVKKRKKVENNETKTK